MSATERYSLLPLRRSVFRDPLCDVAFAPDPAGGKLADGLREAGRLRQLVGSLSRHAEQLSDLCHSKKFHALEITP